MKHAISLIFLFIVSICTSQTVEIDLPRTDFDSLDFSDYSIQINKDAATFKIKEFILNKESAFTTLKEYEGNLSDIDSVHIATDNKDRVCGLSIYSCSKVFRKTNIGIRDFIIDEPELVDKISLSEWKFDENIDRIQEVAETFRKHRKNKGSCELKNVRGIALMGSFDIDSGTGNVFLNGHSSMSKYSEFEVRKHLINCIPKETLDSLNLIQVDFEFNPSGKLIVNNPILHKTKLNRDRNLKKVIKDCLSTMEGWSVKQRKFESKNRTSYLLSVKSKDIKGEILNTINQVEIDSDKRKEAKSSSPKKEKKEVQLDAIFDAMSMEDSYEKEEVFKVVEKMPTLINDDFYIDIIEQIKDKFPESEYNAIFQFTVDTRGVIKDVKLYRLSKTENKKLSTFIKDQLENKKAFHPGKQRGQIVSVQMTKQFKN